MELTEAVEQFFSGEGWPIEALLEGQLYETSFEGDSGVWPVHVHVYDADSRVVLVSTWTGLVDEARRPAMAELCNRANFGLAIGNFELDHDTGEVRFRTSIDTEHAELTPALVRNLAVANMITFDQYLPAIEGVAAGSPADLAVRAVEEAEEAEEEEAEGET
jgi:hypothetical protein